jgi:hypothetical protein
MHASHDSLVPKGCPNNIEKRVARSVIEEKLPELQNNPFKKPILEHFEVKQTNPTALVFDFDHFLEMASSFSPDAPFECKAALAFDLYGVWCCCCCCCCCCFCCCCCCVCSHVQISTTTARSMITMLRR